MQLLETNTHQIQHVPIPHVLADYTHQKNIAWLYSITSLHLYTFKFVLSYLN